MWRWFKLIFLGILLAASFSQNSNVLAASNGLMDSAWPVFHGNSKLTGQSKYDTSKINGGTKWKFKTEGQIETSPVLDFEGNIYLSDQKCNLYAVTANGKEKWKFNAGEPIISKEWGGFGSCSQSSPVIDKDGTVYFLPMTGNFYAIDKNGKEKWHYPVHTFKNAWPSPAIGADGTIYIGSESYPPPESGKPTEKSASFYAFNPDGTLKWENNFKGSSWVNSTPSIDDDGTIYTTANDCQNNCDNGIFALNPDGTIKWKFLPPNGVLEGSVVIGKDKTLYFTTKGKNDPRNANFYAINPDGKEKWKFPLPNGASITPAVTDDGKIYFGDWGGIFYALDLNGKELWQAQTPPAFEALSSSPAVGSEGTVYFGTVANYFYAYTPAGKEKWKISLGDTYVVSSPAIGTDGTIYFADIQGNLYALGEDKIKNSKNTTSASTENSKLPINLTLIIPGLIALLSIGGAIFLFVKKKKKIHIMIFVAFGLIAIAILSYFYFSDSLKSTNSPSQINNQNSSQQNSQDSKCPRRVYGSPDKGYYGIYEMQQIDMTDKEIEWAKKNCPDTYWVGQGEVGQPGLKED